MDMSWFDLQNVGALASIAGLLPSFAAWFTSEYRARRGKKKEEAKDIIEQYIEWLRRQRHDELLKSLSSSQEALNQLNYLVKELMVKSEKECKVVLARLKSMDGGLHEKLDLIDVKVDKLGEAGLRPEKEAEGLWPEVSGPFGGPKVSTPFAGREEELRELEAGMSGEGTVVAVVGMAGQGKSCLAGEWYKRGARPPEGVGLFWRRVYEAGYSFDKFVNDLHLYLTGREIDARAVPSVEGRAALALAVLKGRPCWIVLDGAERWLKRWAAQPDAGVENPTVDDKAGQDEVLDKFLKEAAFWDNGSRLVLTTRAVPSALDDSPPVMVGQRHGREKRLADLKEAEAVQLLKDLGVEGAEGEMRQAVGAYGCHAFGVHVLGLLISELYGGDVSRWEEVSPLEEKKKGRDVGGLFARVVEHRKEDVGLLSLLACSVGPGPVEMVGELLGQEEKAVRKRLAELDKWQMVEFGKKDAEEHTVVRQYIQGRMGQERVREVRKGIARWWVEREVELNPTRREEIEPLLKAVEHLLAAGEPDAATDIFFTKPSDESYYSVSKWLRMFGYLDEDIRINGDAIRVYEEVIEKEGRRELRNDLAMCYNNRGVALQAQGKLAEAIGDYGRAIEIYKELVEKEGRWELRNDLAGCYNNRGGALQAQGKLADAIVDFGRAIEIREELVEKEGRRELRNDLAGSYNNRGVALRAQGKLAEAIEDYGRAIAIREELVEKEGRRELRWDLFSSLFNRALARSGRGEWKEARADVERGGGLLIELIEEGQRHVLSSFMKTAGFRCGCARELARIFHRIFGFFDRQMA